MTPRKALIAAALLLVASPAVAQTVHQDWQSFSGGGKCWASTKPVNSTGNIPGRSAPFLSIQNHPSEGVRGSIAVVAGFDAAGEGNVRLEVNGREFSVLPFRNAAFVASGRPESNLISAMRSGRELVVTWTGEDGTTATDSYSLMGFTAAKDRIDRECR